MALLLWHGTFFHLIRHLHDLFCRIEASPIYARTLTRHHLPSISRLQVLRPERICPTLKRSYRVNLAPLSIEKNTGPVRVRTKLPLILVTWIQVFIQKCFLGNIQELADFQRLFRCAIHHPFGIHTTGAASRTGKTQSCLIKFVSLHCSTQNKWQG